MNNAIYRDVYNLHAESLGLVNDPRFWDDFFWPRVHALAEKHGNDIFFIEMAIAVHGELERRQRVGDCSADYKQGRAGSVDKPA